MKTTDKIIQAYNNAKVPVECHERDRLAVKYAFQMAQLIEEICDLQFSKVLYVNWHFRMEQLSKDLQAFQGLEKE